MTDGSNPLLVFALVLVAGTVSGALVRRIRLPSVTGQIIAGILLGPSVLGVFGHSAVDGLQPVTHFALALMAVAVGSHLTLRRLRNAKKRLLLMLLFEATLTPLLVFTAVTLGSDAGWQVAVLLATIAVSTAPATILAIVKETRSRGVFVQTLVASVALNNIVCIAMFEIAHMVTSVSLGSEGAVSALALMGGPLGGLLASAALGAAIGMALIGFTRHTVRPDRLATISLVAILLTAGIAEALGMSTLLSCMSLGVTLANVTPDKDEIGHAAFANFDSAIFAVFFTLAGIELDFGYVVPGGALALLMVGARATGKIAAARTAMSLAGATDALRKTLGAALIPQAGLAVGLMLLVTEDPVFEPIANLFLAVVLTAVTINELVGPIMTRLALAKSGDFGKDRARLIDFLREDNIVTDLKATSKEDAIRQLTEVLIRTNHLDADGDALLESILAREADMSTCIGGGLAVPHGVLTNGDQMVGAMGVSRDGLKFQTPDGRPVHCMVVLATPPTQRDRHLEVLAALARAIGTDPSVQRQVFHAKSPAHTYEILHAEEAEDFNYFLEDV